MREKEKQKRKENGDLSSPQKRKKKQRKKEREKKLKLKQDQFVRATSEKSCDPQTHGSSCDNTHDQTSKKRKREQYFDGDEREIIECCGHDGIAERRSKEQIDNDFTGCDEAFSDSHKRKKKKRKRDLDDASGKLVDAKLRDKLHYEMIADNPDDGNINGKRRKRKTNTEGPEEVCKRDLAFCSNENTAQELHSRKKKNKIQPDPLQEQGDGREMIVNDTVTKDMDSADAENSENKKKNKRKKKKQADACKKEGDGQDVIVNYTVTKDMDSLDANNTEYKKKRKKRNKKKKKKKADPCKKQRDGQEMIVNDTVTKAMDSSDAKNTENKKISKRHKKKRKSNGLKPLSEGTKLLSCGSKWKKEEGKHYLSGRWTKKEKDILDENLTRIANAAGTVDLEADLLKDVRLQDGTTMPWPEFVKSSKFFDNAIFRLDRTKTSLWHHLIFTKQTSFKSGKWSEDEVKELIKLQARFGNRWVQIVKYMPGRNTKSICMKWRESRVTNKGPWTEEELERLRFALEMLSSDKDSYCKVNWVIVAGIVGTRSFPQCRKKLGNDPKCVFPQKDACRWSIIDNITLIESVSNTNEYYECDIDWDIIASNWKAKTIVNPRFLSNKWGQLKRRYITDFINKEFEDIMEELNDVALPKLKAELKKRRDAVKIQKE